ncbi:ankyrin repeat domain-containing protein [Spirochaetota bacterium]
MRLPAVRTIFLILMIMVSAFYVSLKAETYSVGDKIEVIWSGQWYKAKVLKVSASKYYITYIGWASKWDEWVGPDRIRRKGAPIKKKEKKEIKKDPSKDSKTDFIMPILYGAPTIKPRNKVAWMSSYSMKTTNSHYGNSVVAYFPDGKSIVTGDAGDYTGSYTEAGSVIRWDLRSHKKLWNVKPFKGTLYGGNFASIDELQVSPDGRYIAVVPSGSRINCPLALKIINARDGSTHRTIEIKSTFPHCEGIHNDKSVMLFPTEVHFSKDSRYVYALFRNQYGANFGSCTPMRDRWIVKIDINSKEILWKYHIVVPPVQEMNFARWRCGLPMPRMDLSPDGEKLAVGGCMGTIAIINTSSGKEMYRIQSFAVVLRKLKLARGYDFTGGHARIRDNYAIADLAFRPGDSDTIYASVGNYGYKTIIAMASLSKRKFHRKVLTSVDDPMCKIEFNRDGRFLAIGGNHLYLLDLKKRKTLYSIYWSTGWAYKFRFNPMYKEIVTPSAKDIVFLHTRPRRKIFVAGKDLANTGYYSGGHSSIYMRSVKGEVILGWDNRKVDGITYKELFNTGFKSESNEGSGKFLFIKSEFPDETRKVVIYGGLTRRELDKNYLRSRLPAWGSYPESEDIIYPEDKKEKIIDYYKKSESEIVMKRNIIQYVFSFKGKYMSQDWQSYRDKWKKDINKGNNPGEVGKLLMDFEKKIKDSALVNRWRSYKRNHWHRDLWNARNYIQLAHAMKLIDEHVYFKALQGDFVKKRRKYWLREFDDVIKYGERRRRDIRDKKRKKIVVPSGKENEMLRYGVTSGNLDKVKAALDVGANIDTRYRFGNTLLMEAVARSQVEIIKYLLSRGANINAVNDHGNGALMIASSIQTDESPWILKYIIKKGAKIDNQDKTGWTALMNAAYRGNGDSLEILIGSGADLHLKNKKGETALSLARNPGIYRMLKKAGAKY